MRRILVMASTLAMVAVLAGCTTNPGGTAGTPLDPTATATRDAGPSDDQITAWVDHSAPAKSDVGADTVQEYKGVYNLPVPCPDAWVGLSNLVWTHVWYWTGGPIHYLIQQVLGVRSPGAKDQAAAVLYYTHSCKTYQRKDSANTYTVTIAGDYPVATPDGLDGAVAWCEQVAPSDGVGSTQPSCNAILSKGPVLMWLTVYGEVATIASAQSKLDLAIRLTVPAFVAAAPH